MSVLDDLPRGGAKTGKMPMSAWLPENWLRDSRKFTFNNAKLFLGVIDGTCQFDEEAREYVVSGGKPLGLGDDRHAIVCCASRAGKGRSIIVPTLLEYAGSTLVIDPKGELANITARRRAALGQDVHILDPFEITHEHVKDYRRRFNFLAHLPEDFPGEEKPEMIANAASLADGIVVRGDGKDPHWDDSATAGIEGLILQTATYPGHSHERNLATIFKLLTPQNVHTCNDGSELQGLPALRHQMGLFPDRLKGAVLDARDEFFDRPKAERGSVLSTMRRHLKFLRYPEIQNVVSGHDFDLADLKRKPTTIYLVLPPSKMSSCARWLRLFINQVFDMMEAEDARPAVPVLMCLEEFAVLGHMRQIETAAGLIAGYSCKLLLILQDLAQIKRLYGASYETFLGNSGTQVFFGNNDPTTLEYIAKRLGKTTVAVPSKSDPSIEQRKHGVTGDNLSYQQTDLLGPEEVSRFVGRDDPQQRAVVITPSLPPAIIQRIKYDRHALFEGKFDPA